MPNIVDRFYREQRSCFPMKNCGGVPGGEGFLMRLPECNVLIDTGYGFSAKRLVENIKRELDGQGLDYILLTHSHYDHAMGSAYCKREFPQAKIIASSYCAQILEKPSARAAIRKMDNSAAAAYRLPEGEDLTELLSVDITVEDGDVLTLGSQEVQVLALPGHTKCCVGYYFVKQRFLISCETIGIYVGNMRAMPGCLVGYQSSLDSIDRVMQLPVDQLLLSHHGMLYGDRINEFLSEARKCTVEAKNLVMDSWRNGDPVEKTVQLYREAYYSKEVSLYYPNAAFKANIAAQIPMFIRECAEEA